MKKSSLRIFSALFLLLALAAPAQDLNSAFREAEAAFKGRSQSVCIPLFQSLIDGILKARNERTLTLEEIDLLSRSLDYLGQTHFNLNQQDEARAALLRLIEVNPAYTIDADLVSSKFIDVFNNLKAGHLATMSISVVPEGATVTLNGRPIETASAPVSVLKGQHTLEARKSGYLPETRAVTVDAQENVSVNFDLKVDPSRALIYDKSMEQLRRSDAVAAREALERVLSEDEGNALARAALAEAHLLLGSNKKAREEGARALKAPAGLNPEQLSVLEGIAKEAEGNYEAASAIHAAHVASHPDSIDAAVRLARSQLASDNARDAVESVRRQRFRSGSDPRLDLLEAEASELLADYSDQRTLALSAATAADAANAPFLASRARLVEARALAMLKNELQAKRIFEQVRDSAEAARDRLIQAGAQLGLARLRMSEDPSAAEKEFQTAEALLQELGNESLIPETKLGLADAAFAQKNHARAKTLYESALTGIKGPRRAALLLHLGETHEALNDAVGAIPLFEEALRLGREFKNGAVVANALLRLAPSSGGAQIVSHYEEAATLFEELGDTRHRADALFLLAQALEQRGEADAARMRYEQAAAMYRSAGEPQMAEQVQNRLQTGEAPEQEQLSVQYVDEHNRIVLFLQQGFEALNSKDYAGAVASYEQALQMAKRIGDFSGQASALNSIGFVYSRQGDDSTARDRWRQALDAAQKGADKAAQALALYNLSTAEFNLGNQQQADALYEQSAEVCKEIGQPPRPKPW